ncbi:SpoIID/LytB domain-containing protein [Fibrobacterota bacterium]
MKLPQVKFPWLKPFVKIALHTGKNTFQFASMGRLDVFEKTQDLENNLGTLRGEFSIKRNGQLLEIYQGKGNRINAATGALAIRSQNAFNTIEAEGHSYRGNLEIVHGRGNTLLLINIVAVEDYLRGVLPYEMPSKDRGILEALKAQAIAARTYAMAHQGQHASRGFDMYADERDQIYRGTTAETFVADKAISQTRGILLTYKNELAVCYYHSTCGGHTANHHQVWSGKNIPYLTAQSDKDAAGVNFCKKSNYTIWYESWELEKLAGIIRQNIKSAGVENPVTFAELTGLKVLDRTKSGRVQTLEIQTDQGAMLVKGDKIRWALRRDANRSPILFSSWFDIVKFGPKVLLFGRGNGHGIGMCQTGAMERARRGQAFMEILYSYYKGSQLVQMKEDVEAGASNKQGK